MSDIRRVAEEFRKAAEIEAQTPITVKPEMITIPKSQYLELLADSKLLRHLEALGVDNWEGYCTPDDDDEDWDD